MQWSYAHSLQQDPKTPLMAKNKYKTFLNIFLARTDLIPSSNSASANVPPQYDYLFYYSGHFKTADINDLLKTIFPTVPRIEAETISSLDQGIFGLCISEHNFSFVKINAPELINCNLQSTKGRDMSLLLYQITYKLEHLLQFFRGDKYLPQKKLFCGNNPDAKWFQEYAKISDQWRNIVNLDLPNNYILQNICDELGMPECYRPIIDINDKQTESTIIDECNIPFLETLVSIGPFYKRYKEHSRQKRDLSFYHQETQNAPGAILSALESDRQALKILAANGELTLNNLVKVSSVSGKTALAVREHNLVFNVINAISQQKDIGALFVQTLESAIFEVNALVDSLVHLAEHVSQNAFDVTACESTHDQIFCYLGKIDVEIHENTLILKGPVQEITIENTTKVVCVPQAEGISEMNGKMILAQDSTKIHSLMSDGQIVDSNTPLKYNTDLESMFYITIGDIKCYFNLLERDTVLMACDKGITLHKDDNSTTTLERYVSSKLTKTDFPLQVNQQIIDYSQVEKNVERLKHISLALPPAAKLVSADFLNFLVAKHVQHRQTARVVLEELVRNNPQMRDFILAVTITGSVLFISTISLIVYLGYKKYKKRKARRAPKRGKADYELVPRAPRVTAGRSAQVFKPRSVGS